MGTKNIFNPTEKDNIGRQFILLVRGGKLAFSDCFSKKETRNIFNLAPGLVILKMIMIDVENILYFVK